jgi:hypothetical protein
MISLARYAKPQKTFASQIHQSSPSESSRETELRDTIEVIDYSAIFISAELIAPVELQFSTKFPWVGSNRKEMLCALCGIAVNCCWGIGKSRRGICGGCWGHWKWN